MTKIFNKYMDAAAKQLLLFGFPEINDIREY